jgi:tRNA threonylcarbamoyladenosine biosynthesis protein TsaE
VVDRFAPLLSDKTIVALQGPMGVGKTEFVKHLCGKFRSDVVASPTFAVHHRYSSLRGAIDHLDLYRLENEDDLETTGFWDLLSADTGLIFIEWPEKMNLDHLPFSWRLLMVEIRFISEDENDVDKDSERMIKVFERQIERNN